LSAQTIFWVLRATFLATSPGWAIAPHRSRFNFLQPSLGTRRRPTVFARFSLRIDRVNMNVGRWATDPGPGATILSSHSWATKTCVTRHGYRARGKSCLDGVARTEASGFSCAPNARTPQKMLQNLPMWKTCQALTLNSKVMTTDL
jgi:hypothetical protein